MSGRLPDFLIVGAMKAATTAMAQYLAAHPQVYVPPEKELNFFERSDLWERGPEWYAARFAAAGDAVAVGEASPSYMYWPAAIERMASVLPRARLIVLLRDPIERAHSHYLHWHFDMVRDDRSFEEAVEAELASGPRARGLDRQAGEFDFDYLARGVYLPQLQAICDHYPREAVLVELVDDLRRDPRATFARVCRFLGIDDAVLPDNVGTVVNPHHVFRPVWLWRLSVRRDLWRWVPRRWRLPLIHRMGAGEAIPDPIEPQMRERLVEHFAAHNAALGEWLGRDLSAWGAPPPGGHPIP